MPDQLSHYAEQFMSLLDRLKQLSPEVPPPKLARITPTQLAMINFIAEQPGCGVHDLAEALRLSTPTISVSVRQIEETGFIQRQPDSQDGRAVQFCLTPAGKGFQQKTFQYRRRMFERLLIGLSETERTSLINLLEKAVQSAEKLPKSSSF